MSAVQVGLTGGIGSGKSTAAKLFAELGAKIIDADVLSREATDDPGILTQITDAFGANLVVNGALDRKALADVVFQDNDARLRLNSIVHPWVQRRRAELMDEYADANVVVHEIPLLFEVGMEHMFDTLVVVTASEELRAQRVYERSGLSIVEFTARDRAQIPLSEKEEKAHYVINNGGSFERLRAQVKEIWRELVAPE